MDAYIVFSTIEGDVYATPYKKCWSGIKRKIERVTQIVRFAVVQANSAHGALIADEAYPVLRSAHTHNVLTRRGY